MALDTEQISAGNVTATQIEAAYEPLNEKTDEFEFCVLDFVSGVLAVAGIEDEATFTRSQIVNRQEEVEMFLSAAEYLDEEYLTEKILTLLGDGDKVDEVVKRKIAEETKRFSSGNANKVFE